MSAQHYTAEDFTAARHTYELTPRDETIVSMDYQQYGLGSNACGPRVMEQYTLPAREYVFGVRLRGFSIDADDPQRLARLQMKG